MTRHGRNRRIAATLGRLHKSGHLVSSLRAACWTLGAARRARRELTERGIGAVHLPPVPPLPLGARAGVAVVLRRSTYTCLERSLVRQAWLAAHDDRRDLVIGVRPPGKGFAAHAWLEGDPPCLGQGYAEILRKPAHCKPAHCKPAH